MSEDDGTRAKPPAGRIRRYLGGFAKLYVFVNSAVFFASFTFVLLTELG